MRILIKNCTLVSMDKNRPEFEENMDILIENETIFKIGKKIVGIDVDKMIDACRKCNNARTY